MLFLTLLRHGRSQADDENKYEGRYDSELTETGRQQTMQLINEWKNHQRRKYEVIITSPLKRTKSTAEIISSLYKVPIVEIDNLIELDAGALKGMDKSEGLRKYPPPSFSTPYNRIVEGTGESEAQLHARALLAIETIINMNKKSCLIISHGVIMNAILRNIMSIPIPINGSGTTFRFSDTAYMDIAYEEKNHVWTILNLQNRY